MASDSSSPRPSIGSEEFQLRLFRGDPDAPQEPLRIEPPEQISADMTLSQFYQGCVRRQHVAAGDSPRNLAVLDLAMEYWVQFTGDPSLATIVRNDFIAVRFVEGLWTLPGQRRGTKVGAATVHKYCRTVQSILDRARTKDRRTNPYGWGLVPDVPLLEKPELPEDDVEDNWTLEEIGRMLAGCPQLEATTLDYGPFPGWWSRAIRFDYNVGMRIGSLRELRFTWLRRDELGPWLIVPREFIKVFKRQRFFLNRWAEEIVEEQRIRVAAYKPGDDRIFPWDCGESWLYSVFRRLLAIAGIPAERAHGNKFHGLRKALATELGKINGIAEKMAMGRGKRDVDIRSYVHRVVLVESLNKLPQPGG